ncbi:glycosyltransferase [Candidatus Saccharibacteria bacterium]|nr:glycosyltransferase [Candidatus Saccharibacteria bacterium]
MSRVDLTVVVTTHSEGLVTHKTMLSVFEGTKRIEEAGYNYEILVHIDNGDKATKQYFKRYKDDKNNKKIRVFENGFGDSGLSRNFAVQKARGEYIAFLDGGDLTSDNWYERALAKLKKSNEEIVVHPEAVMSFYSFDQGIYLMYQKAAAPSDSTTLSLIDANLWYSAVMARRKTFLKVPYTKKTPGYSFDDYVFNIEIINAGIKHEIADSTVLFYRRSSALFSSEDREHAIIPYMELFNYQKIKKIELNSKMDDAEPVRSINRIKQNKMYRAIRENRVLNSFITPMASLFVKKQAEEDKGDSSFDFVVREWKKINRIETQLYPYKRNLECIQMCPNDVQTRIGEAYCEVSKMISKKPDYVFIVPWLVRGGGDKVVLNYIEALHELHKDWHFAVIATEANAESPWADRLPGCADFIEFGKYVPKLNMAELDKLMSLIITQLDCKRLHIVNSMYGYNWAIRHKDLIGDNYDLNVTLFNEEPIPESNGEGVFAYDDPYLRDIIEVTRMVSTDNQRMVNRMFAQNGFDNKAQFKVHYQPMLDMECKMPKKEFVEDGKLHILWAGRVAPVKMPEIVAEIGRRLDPEKYSIDVYGEISGGVDNHIFDNIRTIKYHGSYDSFDALPLEKYDLLLYTSWNDGMPNTILEATAAGLPVIASDDGGVGEFIQDDKTGLLVKDMVNPNAYIEIIKGVKDIQKLRKYVENAQKLLKTRHSWDAFLKNVRKDLVDGKNK